jgi:hypothetical protein
MPKKKKSEKTRSKQLSDVLKAHKKLELELKRVKKQISAIPYGTRADIPYTDR